MDTKVTLTEPLFTHEHILSRIVPTSEGILKDVMQLDPLTLSAYNRVKAADACALLSKYSITSLGYKSDLEDYSYHLYRYNDFHSFISVVKHRSACLDLGVILGIPDCHLLLGFNSDAESEASPLDLLILDRYFNYHYINRHLNDIKAAFKRYLDLFKGNVLSAECPFITLKEVPEGFTTRTQDHVFCVFA